MINKDIIQRFLFENTFIRGELVRLDQTFQTITAQHQYPPAIRHLLGETLAVSALLSAIIKFKGRLTVQFQGNGKLKLLLAQADQDFHLRGLARFAEGIVQEDLNSALQEGLLTVTVDPTEGGQRYQGIVAWSGETIAQSVENYFKTSEQLPTRIWLAVNETTAVGLLLQIIPQNTPHQANDDWEHITTLTSTITPAELLSLDNATLLQRLYAQEDVRLFSSDPVIFRCTCSRERGENAIIFLGREEIAEELNEKQVIIVKCDFCSKEFTYDRIDVETIFKKGHTPPSSSQVH